MTDSNNTSKPTHLTNLTWPQAQVLCQDGYIVHRKGWNGKHMFVAFNGGVENLPADKFWVPANRRAAEQNGGAMTVAPYFTLKTAQNTIQMGWVPSIGDLSATDWEAIKDNG